MANVTDGSLLSIAQDIVTEFMDNKTTLNEGVMKKASELGLNNDQTQRLIERTNTEAFLRVYPNDTDFEVASPEVILGVKTASITPAKSVPLAADDGLFKAASVEKKAGSTGIPVSPEYAAAISKVSEEDIFGMDEEFYKEAKATEYEPVYDIEFKTMWRAMNDIQKTAAEIELENADRELRFGNAVESFAKHIKQASLDGVQSIESSEHELLNMYPENSGLIRCIYDNIVTKMASDGVDSQSLTRSSDVLMQKFAHESELTKKFQDILDIISEV